MKRALVLIPGLNNTRAVFGRVLPELTAAQSAVQVYVRDNPALPSVDAIANGLLAGLPERFWLAGFSFGGYVAMAVLAAAPERVEGIALICSAPGADDAGALARRQLALEAVAQGRYPEMIRAQAANAFHPDSLNNAALLAERWAMVEEYGARRYAAHLRACIARPDRSALLDGNKSTLVVGASHDQVFPPQALAYATAIPGCHRVTIEGAGHLLPMEQPAALARCLAHWMDGS